MKFTLHRHKPTGSPMVLTRIVTPYQDHEYTYETCICGATRDTLTNHHSGTKITEDWIPPPSKERSQR